MLLPSFSFLPTRTYVYKYLAFVGSTQRSGNFSLASSASQFAAVCAPVDVVTHVGFENIPGERLRTLVEDVDFAADVGSCIVCHGHEAFIAWFIAWWRLCAWQSPSRDCVVRVLMELVNGCFHWDCSLMLWLEEEIEMKSCRLSGAESLAWNFTLTFYVTVTLHTLSRTSSHAATLWAVWNALKMHG